VDGVAEEVKGDDDGCDSAANEDRESQVEVDHTASSLNHLAPRDNAMRFGHVRGFGLEVE